MSGFFEVWCAILLALFSATFARFSSSSWADALVALAEWAVIAAVGVLIIFAGASFGLD